MSQLKGAVLGLVAKLYEKYVVVAARSVIKNWLMVVFWDETLVDPAESPYLNPPESGLGSM